MRPHLALLLSALAALSTHTAARAEPAPAQDGARALETGYGALKLYEQGRYQDALLLFTEAEALAHSPVFVLYMARCHRELGQLVAAKALFETVRREELPAGAPAAWNDAARSAAAELHDLAERIPSARVVVRGDPTPPLTLQDGPRSLPVPVGGATLELDPGSRALTVTDAAGRRVRRQVDLEPGEKAAVLVFDFEPPPAAGAAGAVPAPPRADEHGAAPPPHAAGTQWGGWTALGLGAGALGFGATAGVVALRKASDARVSCVGNRCPAGDRELADSARRWGNLATAAFVVGAVSATTGVTLLLLRPSGASATTVSVRVQPAGIAVEGRL